MPASIQMDDKGVWIGGPTGGYRVHDVQVYSKETGAYESLDLATSYNLATTTPYGIWATASICLTVL